MMMDAQVHGKYVEILLYDTTAVPTVSNHGAHLLCDGASHRVGVPHFANAPEVYFMEPL